MIEVGSIQAVVRPPLNGARGRRRGASTSFAARAFIALPIVLQSARGLARSLLHIEVRILEVQLAPSTWRSWVVVEAMANGDGDEEIHGLLGERGR